MSENNLTSVVITRPLARSAGLLTRLMELNLRPVSMPLMDTAPARNPVAIRQLIDTILPLKWAIFTSITAVEQTFMLVSPKRFAGTGIAAIGASTARALLQAGFDRVLLPEAGYTSEALLETPELNVADTGKAAIFCAPGGRHLLFDSLSKRGWQVFDIPVYRRIELTPEQAVRDEIIKSMRLIVVFTSAAAMAICQKNLPENIWHVLRRADWVVVSRRLAERARHYGADQVHVAQGPDNQAIAAMVAAVAQRN